MRPDLREFQKPLPKEGVLDESGKPARDNEIERRQKLAAEWVAQPLDHAYWMPLQVARALTKANTEASTLQPFFKRKIDYVALMDSTLFIAFVE